MLLTKMAMLVMLANPGLSINVERVDSIEAGPQYIGWAASDSANHKTQCTISVRYDAENPEYVMAHELAHCVDNHTGHVGHTHTFDSINEDMHSYFDLVYAPYTMGD